MKTIPFSSARKKMSCVIKVDDKTLRVFCKGAPDYIIAKCVSFIAPDGTI